MRSLNLCFALILCMPSESAPVPSHPLDGRTFKLWSQGSSDIADSGWIGYQDDGKYMFASYNQQDDAMPVEFHAVEEQPDTYKIRSVWRHDAEGDSWVSFCTWVCGFDKWIRASYREKDAMPLLFMAQADGSYIMQNQWDGEERYFVGIRNGDQEMSATYEEQTSAMRVTLSEEPYSHPPWQNVVARGSELCLDLPGGNAYDGQPLWLWTCAADSANQRWAFVNGQMVFDGDNVWVYCLDLPGGLQSPDGTQLWLWTCGGWPQQQWVYDDQAATIYLSDDEGGHRCMQSRADAPFLDGVPVEIGACYGSANQIWDVTKKGPEERIAVV